MTKRAAVLATGCHHFCAASKSGPLQYIWIRRNTRDGPPGPSREPSVPVKTRAAEAPFRHTTMLFMEGPRNGDSNS